MVLAHCKNRILRIPIGVVMCFILCQCTEYEIPKEISKTDQQSLELIDENINKDLETTDVHIDELITKAIANKDSLLLANAYLRRGIVLTKKGEFKNSIDTLKRGVDIIQDYKDLPLKNLFLLRIGNNYALDDKSAIALNYYLPVYEDAKSKNNVEHLFKSSVNIAKIRRNAGKFEDALDKYKTAYKQTEELKVAKRNIARVLMGIGGTYLKLQEPDSALHYSKKGLKISESIDDKFGESYFYNDFGIAYFLKEDYKQSLENLTKAEVYIESINNEKRLSETFFYKGSCYYKTLTYEKAITYFEKVISIVNKSEKLDNKKFRPLFLEDTYDLLSKCYLALGNTNQSHLYETKRNELAVIINKENYQIVDALHESEIRINNEFIKKTQVSTARKIVRYKWVLIVVGLFCLASLYFVLYYKKEAKKNKEIFERLVKKQEIQPKKSPSKITISDVKVREVLQKLEKIEQQEYYLEATCSLTNMAKKVKTNGTYLSKILKEQKGKTFYEYLNELRINYTINRLKTDKQFRNYAIMHIAKDVGYKSPESFTKHFKIATGIYPSYYIKELKKIDKVKVK